MRFWQEVQTLPRGVRSVWHRPYTEAMGSSPDERETLFFGLKNWDPPRERQPTGRQRDWPSSWFGLLVALGCLTIVAVILWPVLAPAPVVDGHQRSCDTRLKLVRLSVEMYCGDFDETYPPANWMDATKPYAHSDDALRCYELRKVKKAAYGTAMAKGVVSAKLSTIAPDTVVIFETSIEGRNAVSDLSTLAYRHGLNRGFLKADEPASAVAFQSGKAKFVRPGETLLEAR